MSEIDSSPTHVDDEEFERLGRRAGAELRLPPPVDGPGSIHRTARRRRAASMSTTVAVVLALVVGGLIVVNRNRHVDDDDEPSTATTLSPTVIPLRVQLTGRTGLVAAIDFSADGRLFVTADDTTLRVWDSFTGRQLREISLDATSPTNAVAFSANGKSVGAHQVDRGAKFWSVADGRIAAPFPTAWNIPSYSGGGVSGNQVLSRDGKMAVVLGRLTGASLVDEATGTRLQQLGSTGTAYAAVFAGDGKTVAVKFDRTVRLWQLAPFEELPVVEFPTYQATAERMTFSPDGTRIAFTVENSVIIQRIGATP